MRQKIRFTIFYLYQQNKTNKNNFCGPVVGIYEENANTIFQIIIINLSCVENTCNDFHKVLAIFDTLTISFLTASK